MNSISGLVREINVRDELTGDERDTLNILFCKNKVSIKQLAREWDMSYHRLYNSITGRTGSSPLARYLLRKYLKDNGCEFKKLKTEGGE